MSPGGYFERLAAMMVDNVLIEPIRPQEMPAMIDLIRDTLERYEEAGSVLASTNRRIANFRGTYDNEDSSYLAARDIDRNTIIGGAGVGPLAGLPKSEGMGEIRELVLQDAYRGRGLGTRLLHACLQKAKELGYRRIYLETTPQMENAQRLFRRFGFRPVRHQSSKKREDQDDGSSLPFYFLLEDIDQALKVRRTD